MRTSLNEVMRKLPLVGEFAARIHRKVTVGDSSAYWDRRYKAGGTSGAGSYDRLAEFKAQVLNAFVEQHRIESVIEHGCGDGAQLRLARYPRYTGLDVSPTAIEECRRIFAGDRSKQFLEVSHLPADLTADLALSLDVVYHLIEDRIFDRYMRCLFASARQNVIIYSSNREERTRELHVRHRHFTSWIEKNAPRWQLQAHIPNAFPYDSADPLHTSFADFYFFSAPHRQGPEYTNRRKALAPRLELSFCSEPHQACRFVVLGKTTLDREPQHAFRTIPKREILYSS